MMWRVCRLFLLVIFGVASQVNAAFWSVEFVYDEGLGSGDCWLVMDHLGIPHVCYTADGTLYFASKIVGGWSASAIVSVGYWGGLTSLVFDNEGSPCIAFIDGSDPVENTLCFARKSGDWSTEVVTNIGWLAEYVSIAISPGGQPCIAFCRTNDSDVFLSFARRLGAGQWSIENVAQVGSVTGPSLAFAASGSAFIAFAESDSGTLRVARRVGSGWTIDVVDGTSNNPAVSYPALAIDKEGCPVVAYFLRSQSASVLKLAKFTGSAWVKQVVASFPVSIQAGHCAVGFTAAGMPLVPFHDPSTSSLKVAWRIDSGWLTEDVDSAQMTGVRPSILCNGSGDVYLCYFDAFEYNVKIARAIAPMTIFQAKCQPDGTIVQMSGVVASTGSGDLGGSLYVQSLDRMNGIKLAFSSSVPGIARGDILDVQGTITTVGGERVLADPLIVVY
ncbi:MAG: hypothetical protein ACUVRS_12110 [Armatimonadota bacterium]